MRTLQEIKDGVANKNGHADWNTLCFRENLTSINLLWEEVSKELAKQAVEEAAERIIGKDLNSNDLSDRSKFVKDSILSVLNDLK